MGQVRGLNGSNDEVRAKAMSISRGRRSPGRADAPAERKPETISRQKKVVGKRKLCGLNNGTRLRNTVGEGLPFGQTPGALGRELW